MADRVLIHNVSGAPVGLPNPYRGLLKPGGFAVVDGQVSEIIASFGGPKLVVGVLEFKPTNDPLTYHNPPSVLKSAHWSFQTNTADGYAGGFYEFDGGNNDFSPAVNWGVADIAYGAHVGFVQGAVSGDQITIRVSGRSVDDIGGETGGDTEDVVILAGAADRYFETAKKWTGLVTIETVAGTPVVFNHGWVKYWDYGNRPFVVQGLEAIWDSDSAIAGSDIELIHHSADGWTYQAAGGPLFTALAQRSVDLTDNENRVGFGAWKRLDIVQAVAGADSEGILFRITSAATGVGTQSFRTLNLTIDFLGA